MCVFVCVNDDILSRSQIFISLSAYHHRFGQKEGESTENQWERRIWVFSKKEVRTEIKERAGEKSVWNLEETSRRGVFQESAKKKTTILILAHVFTTLNKTHLHKHHVCCYSTNRVRRRPQGHQGSGTSEFRFASRAVKVDFERRRWEIFCYRESNQEKKEP